MQCCEDGGKEGGDEGPGLCVSTGVIGVLSVLVVVWFPEIGWPLRMYELI